MEYLLLIIWFPLLIKWADLLTEWGSSIAKKFWLSSLIIWLTIVAFWTSLPEFIVSMLSALDWNSEIAMSNIIWSNTANIFLVLWIAWIIRPLKVQSSTVYKEIPFALLTMLMLSSFVFDKVLNGQTENILSRWEWISLLLVFIIFLYYTFWISQNESTKDENENSEEEVKEMSVLKSSIYILLWLVWLAFWWAWIVDWAVILATNFWMSQSLIWATIIAIWTSLPEVAAIWMAAYKWKTSMAVWGAVGSNIFNVALVLWTTSTFSQIKYSSDLNIDILFAIFATVLLFIFMFIWKKHTLWKPEAILFIILYIIYLIAISMRW